MSNWDKFLVGMGYVLLIWFLIPKPPKAWRKARRG